MKNVLLLLLLANILYFLWGTFHQQGDLPGVEIINPEDLGPTLTLTHAPDVRRSTDTGDVFDAGDGAQFEASVGRACVSLGPFRSATDADDAQTRYVGEGLEVGRRAPLGRIFVGHWVQIRNVPSREEADRMLAILHEGGLTDAYFVQTEDEGMKIALGVFGILASAERMELEARSLGLSAEISPRFSEGTIYFVDLALPPGRGAGDLVERFGEDMVLLRDEATCPQ